MHEKAEKPVEISVCVCEQRDRFVFAVGHNTPARVIKHKILSASIEDLTSTDIWILENNKPCNAPPQDIFSEYLTQAISQHCKDPDAILEFVYFGDVNLTMPGKEIFPDLFIDKNEFSRYIKNYFPNCIIIKRILVSANDTILERAKTIFAEVPRNISAPFIVDSFLNKSHQDFYTEIHRIDSGLIDAVLKYHRLFQNYAYEDDENDLDGFLPIHRASIAIQRKLELLAPRAQGTDYFRQINDLRLNFDQNYDCFMALTNESLFDKKSIILSYVFSFLVPPSLRDDIKDQLEAEGVGVVSDAVFFMELSYPEICEMIGAVIKEKQAYFVLYPETSAQMTEATAKVLTELHAFQSSVLEANFNPDIVKIVDEIIQDTQQLLELLQNKLSTLQTLRDSAERLMEKVNGLSRESLRKKPLSNSAFLKEIPLDKEHLNAKNYYNPGGVNNKSEPIILLKAEKPSYFFHTAAEKTPYIDKNKSFSESNYTEESTNDYFLGPL